MNTNPFECFGFEADPFTTSPDPRFLFRSATHQIALKRLELSLSCRRGINIVYGDVGTGKSTLCRTLVQGFSGDPSFTFRVILDPSFSSEDQFLASLASMFGVTSCYPSATGYKSALHDYLFNARDNKQGLPVLIVDEGQKLSTSSLELLRVLLNYETNEHKLLQIIIFAQNELLEKVEDIPNFSDRVSFSYKLRPLTMGETRQMIDYRLRFAGCKSPASFFPNEAVEEIYAITAGYPRRIVMLCHDALEMLLIRDRKVVDTDILDEILASRP